MFTYFCDLHIHIGGTKSGKPVKITASRNMTLSRILEEASVRKGMDVIGIIDSHVPEVQEELLELLERGLAQPLEGGGIRYKNTTLLLGSEVEIKEKERGEAHFLCYVRDVEVLGQWTAWLAERCKNIHLSSQRIASSVCELQQVVHSLGGVLIPAHIFTPHKGLYGNCTDRMADVLDPACVLAVELGLSANTEMADRISELHDKTFLTNSDAHSLAKIAREYQAIQMASPTYDEWVLALKRADGRRVLVNYGLLPELGKYHRTVCQLCREPLPAYSAQRCPRCGFKSVVRGVEDRVSALADTPVGQHPPHRPPYVEQIPLEFVPGVGPRTREKLYEAFGTEMNILHRVPETDLADVAGEKVAAMLTRARMGFVSVSAGGAGTYGKIQA